MRGRVDRALTPQEVLGNDEGNVSNAYGANIGWINARGDVTNGAVVGYSYCTGYVWSANTLMGAGVWSDVELGLLGPPIVSPMT